MIVLDKVSVAFGRQKVLDQLTLEIAEGEVVGLVAPNGKGKTTIFNLIMNNLKPDAGKMTVDGRTYTDKRDQKRIYEMLSILPNQNDLIAAYTGREHLQLYAAFWHRSPHAIKTVIDQLSLEAFVDHKVDQYSLGMRQRLCFGMQLLLDTKYLLMDEVTNGLDIDNISLVEDVIASLKADGKGIIIISHLLSSLDQMCDRILFLADGQIGLEYFPQSTENERYLILAEKDALEHHIAGPDFQIAQKVYFLESDVDFDASAFVKEDISFEVRALTCKELYKKMYEED